MSQEVERYKERPAIYVATGDDPEVKRAVREFVPIRFSMMDRDGAVLRSVGAGIAGIIAGIALTEATNDDKWDHWVLFAFAIIIMVGFARSATVMYNEHRHMNDYATNRLIAAGKAVKVHPRFVRIVDQHLIRNGIKCTAEELQELMQELWYTADALQKHAIPVIMFPERHDAGFVVQCSGKLLEFAQEVLDHVNDQRADAVRAKRLELQFADLRAAIELGLSYRPDMEE